MSFSLIPQMLLPGYGSLTPEMLRERGFAGECRMEYCEMVSGAHMGPGLVALFFTGEKREK